MSEQTIVCSLCGFEALRFYPADSNKKTKQPISSTASPGSLSVTCPACGGEKSHRMTATWLNDNLNLPRGARVLVIDQGECVLAFLERFVDGEVIAGAALPPDDVGARAVHLVDLYDLTFRDSIFDLVLCPGIPFDGADGRLSELHRVLKPGGIALFRYAANDDSTGHSAVELLEKSGYSASIHPSAGEVEFGDPNSGFETALLVAKKGDGDAIAGAAPVRTRSSSSPLNLDYYLHTARVTNIRPGSPTRDWMNATPEQYAYRCLPLGIANAHCWELFCLSDFTAVWNGGAAIDDTTITQGNPEEPPDALSHFGSGILTFHVPGLFRTPPGYDLFVTGPINEPRSAIQALSAIIETDWTMSGFTMNWKFVDQDQPVMFKKGDTFCSIFPLPRGLIEQFHPHLRHEGSDPAVWARHGETTKSRKQFLEDLCVEDSEARKLGWEKAYFRGPGHEIDPPHRTKIRLKPFSRQK